MLALRYDEYLKSKTEDASLTKTSNSMSGGIAVEDNRNEVDKLSDGESELEDDDTVITTSGATASTFDISDEYNSDTSSEDDSDSDDDDEEEYHCEEFCSPTVLALPVFCSIKVNKRAMTPFMKFRDNGPKVGVCNDHKGRPQVSGIANICENMTTRTKFADYFFKIDKPEEYENWGRFLIQPTSL